MKKGRIIVIAVALLSAGTTAFLATQVLKKPAPQIKQVTKKSSTRVLIAKQPINIGETVAERHIAWQAWPEDVSNPAWIVDKTGSGVAKADVVGLLARASFTSGEPLSRQKLLKRSEGGVMAAILPKGMRALSLPIKEVTAAGRFILPNDRVDVMLTQRLRQQGRGEQVVVRTLLRAVRVLAIGQTKQPKKDKGGDTISGKTATLMVTPTESELLTQARAMGTITLSLRALKDAKLSKEEQEQNSNPFGQRSKGLKMLQYGTASVRYTVD